MQEQRGIVQEVIETNEPVPESKTKKYIRIALGCVGLGFIVLTFIMAFIRRYAS